jgi:hypothetical protein
MMEKPRSGNHNYNNIKSDFNFEKLLFVMKNLKKIRGYRKFPTK